MITLDEKDLLMILLNGNLYSSVAIPLSVGELLKIPFHEEKYHLDHNEGAQFYEFYSKVGWENELLRRSYLESLGVANPKLPPLKTVTKIQSVDIMKQIQEAMSKGDMNEAIRLKGLL